MRRLEGAGLNDRGLLLREMGRLAEAKESWQQALTIAQELEMESLIVDIKAEMAFLAEEMGEFAESQQLLEEVMKQIHNPKIIEASTRPARLYLVTVWLLRKLQDQRANMLLQDAHKQLMDKAKRIASADLRTTFLNKVAAHRAIIQLYEANFPTE